MRIPALPPGNEESRLLEQAARLVQHNQGTKMLDTIAPLVAASVPVVREGRMWINPAIAGDILQNLNYLGQRHVEQHHVAVLAEQMHRKMWTAASQITFAIMSDGRQILINGQHRLAAVIESDAAQEFQIALIPARDYSELAQLYYRFDTVQRKRSVETILSVAGVAERYEIQRMVAKGAYDAATIITCGMKRVPGWMLPASLRTPDGRLKAAHPFWPQVKLYNDLISGAGKEIRPRLINGTVMAVAILTLRDQPETAKPFWSGLAANDGLRKGDPRRALLLALVQKEMMKGDFGILACANAWNAWIEKRPIAYVVVKSGVMPKMRGIKGA